MSNPFHPTTGEPFCRLTSCVQNDQLLQLAEHHQKTALFPLPRGVPTFLPSLPLSTIVKRGHN